MADAVRATSCGRPAPTSVIGNRLWAARWRAAISAASSRSATYCNSSTKSATAVSWSRAASPTDSTSAVRSASRLPLSASPRSGARSRLTFRSPLPTLIAPTNPANALSARRTASLAAAMRFMRTSAACNGGMRRTGSGLSSGASSRRVVNPRHRASWQMRLRSTVLPTPRNPTISMLLAVRPLRMRSRAIAASSISTSRPANSGGGVPAPGA